MLLQWQSEISVVLKDKQLEALLAFMSSKDTSVYSNFLVFTGSAVLQRQQSLFSIAMSTDEPGAAVAGNGHKWVVIYIAST